ncbi:hypothetical protein ANO11243_091470 [Dothideomycetidae sp. 11243]|nr:hypothetical protein ANO11243_091470 [fungal sp. No.11243]
MSYHSRDGLLAVTGSLLGLSTITVGLRFVARRHQRLPIKVDDVMAVVALASIKISAVLFYRRIFHIDGLRSKLDVASIITIPIVIIWAILYTIFQYTECGTHLSAFWLGTAAEYCNLTAPFEISMVVTDLALDLWILAMPLPQVSTTTVTLTVHTDRHQILRLHVTNAKKLSVVGVFLLAFVGVGASVARVVVYSQVYGGGVAYLSTHDEGVMATTTYYLDLLETGISCVAVNLPTLWHVITKLGPEKIVQGFSFLSTLRSKGSSSHLGHVSVTREAEVRVSESTVSLQPSKNHGHIEAYQLENFSA